MSSGPRDAKRLRLSDFFVRIAVPATAALALAAIVTSSAREIDDDLQLIAPDMANPGDPLPVRARLYTGLKRPEGAMLATPEVELELHTPEGRMLAHGRLERAFGGSMQAMLALPREYRGDARLIARTRASSLHAHTERPLRIGATSNATPQPLEARALPPLQRFASGPLHARGSEPVPSALALAIVGGACVPELPCRLFVHVGEPAASVRVRASGAISPEPESARPSRLSAGVVGLQIVTHGPEAELTLIAERDGVEIATRAFRLAIALGASVARELAPILDAPASPTLGLFGDEAGCLVDGFREQRWLRAGSLRGCRGDEAAPFAGLEPGIWRLQLRHDVFGVDSAGVASVYVRGQGESAASVLGRLASAELARDPEDAFARTIARGDTTLAEAELGASASYLLARLDEGLVTLPTPSSGYPLAQLELAAARGRVRKLALLAIALCALTLGAVVAQRGLSAAAEAAQLMADAGEEPARLARQRMRMLLRVFSTVSSLVLVFVAIALYVMIRTQAR